MTALYHQVLTKVCNKCKINKPLDQFGPYPHSRYGVRAVCNECRKPESHDYYVKRYGLRRKQLPEPVNGGKVCRRCEKEKPVTEFTIDKRASDKLGTQCKQCLKEVQELNHTPEERRVNYQRNVERNGDQYRAKGREWKRTHPIEVREMNARREAIKKAAQVDGEVDYIHILERDNCWCYICCGPIYPGQRTAFDHVIPLVPRKGTDRAPGLHTESNIKVTHYLCNARKGNNLLEEMTAHDRRGIQSHTIQPQFDIWKA